MSDNANQLYSNKYKNHIKSSLKRSEISIIRSDVINSERIKEQHMKENYQKYGTGKFIPEGTFARLNAIPFNIPENIMNDGDIISFKSGYYERGTRLIEILIREGYVKSGNIEIKPENYEMALKKIAINDGMNQEIDFDSLPEVIKNNIIYKNGFEVGRELIQTKKARR